MSDAWLTISEGVILAKNVGLDRTPKTIRSWARNGHVEARKKSTATGEMWIIDRGSLETKIKTEIEYRDQLLAQTGSDPSEPVRTSAYQSEPVRTSDTPHYQKATKGNDSRGSDPFEPAQQSPDLVARIRQIENDNMLLKIDVGWRDKLIDQIQQEKKLALENQHAQARYIGHLESELLRLNGKPDQTFLAAPTPVDREEKAPAVEPEVVQPERPHPDQQTFYGQRAA